MTAIPDEIIEAVKADLDDRTRKGIATYGQTVGQSNLPLKSWLQHAYEEALDTAIYLRRAMRDLP